MNLFDLMATLGLDSSSYEKGLNDAEGKANGFGSKLKKGLSTAAKAAGAALTAATTAAVGFGASAVKTGENFDKGMSQVAATMGYTLEELNDGTSEAAKTMEELRVFAQQMGSTTQFSASQAADALNYMALAGYDAETSMSMLPNVLNLAAAGGIDLADASDMVTDAQTALGLSLEETGIMVDQMAKASSKSNTSVAQLGEAFLTIGANAQGLAGGTQELSTALGIMANSGIKGAEAGTHLRNILLSLNPQTEDAAAAMESLGLNAYDSEGNMRPLNDVLSDFNDGLAGMSAQERTNIISSIFNKTDLAAVNALLAGTVVDMSALNDSLADSGVDWSQYFDTAWYQSGELQGLMEELVYNAGASAEEMQEYLTFEYDLSSEDAQMVIAAMQETTESSASSWEQLSEAIGQAEGSAQAMAEVQLDNLAGDITKLKSAFEGAQIAVSDELTPSVREFVQFGTESIGTLTEALRTDGLDGVMEALGTIIADGLNLLIEKVPEMVSLGLTLLQALLTGIIDNLPQIADAAIQIIGTIGTALIENGPELITSLATVLGQIAEKITDPETLGSFIQGVVTLITTMANTFIDNIPAIVETIITILDNLVQVIEENLPIIVQAAIDIMSSLIDGLIEALPTLIGYLPTILETIASVIFDNLPMIIDAGFDLLEALIQGVMDNLPAIIDAFATIIAQIVEFVLQNLPEFIQRGMDLVMSLMQGILDNLPAIMGTIGELIAAIIKAIIENLPQILVQGADILLQLIMGLIGAIPQLVAAIPEIIRAIVEAFQNMDWGEIGRNIVDGIKNGIMNMAGNLAESARQMVSNVVGGIKNFLGIASPSKLFRDQVGEMIGLGLAEGIDKSTEEAVESAEDMAKDVLGTMNGMDAALSTSVGSMSVNSVGNGLTAGGAGVTINVYGAVGQDVNELAEIVSQKIAFVTQRERVAWA